MFDNLKKHIALQESRELEATALEGMLSEEADFDDDVEEIMGLDDGDADVSDDLLDRIPEDPDELESDIDDGGILKGEEYTGDEGVTPAQLATDGIAESLDPELLIALAEADKAAGDKEENEDDAEPDGDADDLSEASLLDIIMGE